METLWLGSRENAQDSGFAAFEAFAVVPSGRVRRTNDLASFPKFPNLYRSRFVHAHPLGRTSQSR